MQQVAGNKKTKKSYKPAGIWPRGQNPRRYSRISRACIDTRTFRKGRNVLVVREGAPDLMKQGAHGGLMWDKERGLTKQLEIESSGS